MSGVVRGVKKVFKKAVKVIKKVAPIVLAAAAVYFTAGAALGVSGAAGGWGAAATKLTSSIGLNGTLGKIITGAVTQAGYGAAIGAATSAVTGGDIMDGMQRGALTGAVTGGVTGGLGFETDPLKGAFDDKITGGVGQEALTGSAGTDTLNTGVSGSPSGFEASGGDPFGTISGDGIVTRGLAGGGPSAAPPSVSAGADSGFLDNVFAKGGWLERNQGLAGGVIKGVGEGLVRGLAAQDQSEAYAERFRQMGDNYRSPSVRGLASGGSVYQPAYDASRNPTVAQKFDRAAFPYRYEFNQQTGRVERVAIG